MATTDVSHAQPLGRGEVRPEARCARLQPAVPALTVSGESVLFYLWFSAEHAWFSIDTRHRAGAAIFNETPARDQPIVVDGT